MRAPISPAETEGVRAVRRVSFRVSDFAAYYRLVVREFEAMQDSTPVS